MKMEFSKTDEPILSKYGEENVLPLSKANRFWISGDLSKMAESYALRCGSSPTRIMELAIVASLSRQLHPPTSELAQRVLDDMAENRALQWYQPVNYIPGRTSIAAISVGGRREARRAQMVDESDNNIAGIELWEYQELSLRRDAVKRCVNLTWKLSSEVDNVIIHRSNLIVGVATNVKWEHLPGNRMRIIDADYYCNDGNDPDDKLGLSELVGSSYIDRSPMSSNPITILRR